VEPWHLVRKVFLLLLLVTALALGLVYLLQWGRAAPALMFNLLADSSIGAAMGLGSRLVLRRRHWLIRAVVAASLSIVGLVLLGFLTDARSGVGPLHLTFQAVNWLDRAGLALQVPVLPGNSPTDLMDAAHMVIAVNLSWISLRAWNGRIRSQESRHESSRLAAGVASISTPRRLSVVAPVSAPAVRPTTTSRSRPLVRRKKIGRVVVAHAMPIRPKNTGSRRRSVFRRRLAVQLAAYEEHRCPYCLQDIKRDDIRVECPVCHTLHHKDCWDITGTCQVPHLNG
jgi:hypothetical protein